MIAKSKLFFLIFLFFSCDCFAKTVKQSLLYNLDAIESSLMAYQEDVGHFPAVSCGLVSLKLNVDNEPRWRGPYVGDEEDFVDVYGSRLIYVCREDQCFVYSAGINGVNESGAGDDVVIVDELYDYFRFIWFGLVWFGCFCYVFNYFFLLALLVSQPCWARQMTRVKQR